MNLVLVRAGTTHIAKVSNGSSQGDAPHEDNDQAVVVNWLTTRTRGFDQIFQWMDNPRYLANDVRVYKTPVLWPNNSQLCGIRHLACRGGTIAIQTGSRPVLSRPRQREFKVVVNLQHSIKLKVNPIPSVHSVERFKKVTVRLAFFYVLQADMHKKAGFIAK